MALLVLKGGPHTNDGDCVSKEDELCLLQCLTAYIPNSPNITMAFGEVSGEERVKTKIKRYSQGLR